MLMRQKTSKFLDKRFWLDLIMPNRCAVCNKILPWDKLCCDNCLEELPYIDKPLCEVCGKPDCICSNGIHYDRCFSIVWYNEQMKAPVVRFKNQSPGNFAMLFAEKLACKIRETDIPAIDVVTAVPMSRSSMKERGYNQAYELAASLAKQLGIEQVSDKILSKRNSRSAQHELSAEERKKVVEKLYYFSGKYDVKGKNILLCDDIITTGSTLDRCAEILKENGAAAVICAVAANTDKSKE